MYAEPQSRLQVLCGGCGAASRRYEACLDLPLMQVLVIQALPQAYPMPVLLTVIWTPDIFLSSRIACMCGEWGVQVVCGGCGAASRRYEACLDLQLEVPAGVDRLEDALARHTAGISRFSSGLPVVALLRVLFVVNKSLHRPYLHALLAPLYCGGACGRG
jgi:hypothetical protein